MMQRETSERVGFDNGISRAFYRALMPQAAQQTACKRGFAGAQVTLQINHQRCTQRFHPACAQRQSRFFVGEKTAHARTISHKIQPCYCDIKYKLCWKLADLQTLQMINLDKVGVKAK